jgi:hypothetical protein
MRTELQRNMAISARVGMVNLLTPPSLIEKAFVANTPYRN